MNCVDSVDFHIFHKIIIGKVGNFSTEKLCGKNVALVIRRSFLFLEDLIFDPNITQSFKKFKPLQPGCIYIY